MNSGARSTSSLPGTVELALTVGVALMLLVGAFALGVRIGRAWVPLAPLALPALLGVLTLAGYLTEDRSDCYEECGYHWLLFFTALALGIAIALGTVAAIGVVVHKQRKSHRGVEPPAAAR
jgi:hypothetical protein